MSAKKQKIQKNEEMSNSKVSMKLLIDTRGKRVLFAEAGKECVDFLFHILSLPVATIVRLLQAQGMAGSLPNLYKSLENLNASYIQPDRNKDTFLKPVVSVAGSSVPLLALDDAPNQRKFYRCNCYNYVSDDPRAMCPACCRRLNSNMTYVAPPAVEVAAEDGGLVKGVVTYMVMDDLVVKPMSTISSITLLNSFNVKEVGALEEKAVNLGMNEVLIS